MADDREQLYQALRNADAAGDTQAAQRLASYIKSLSAAGAAPAQSSGILDTLASIPGRVKEAITGSERSTGETDSLPDWGGMPELNSFSLASAKTGLGTLLANPQETVQVIQSNFPGVKVRQDDKGNFLLRSSIDGKEYAIKPGFRMSDVPRAAAGIAAFTPAGRATTLGGAAAASAATQAVIEGTQAATGGEFNPGDVAMAGAAGAVVPAVVGAARAAATPVKQLVQRARGVKPTVAAQPAAVIDPLATAAAGAEAGTPASAAAAVDPAMAMGAADLAGTARKAAQGGIGSKTATQMLAEQAAPDEKVIEAAKRLGIEEYLQPDHVTTNQTYRELSQAVKSIPGSEARAAELAGLEKVAQRANDLVDELGGTHDVSTLNRNAKRELQATHDEIRGHADNLYAKVRANIPAKAEAPAHNVLAMINARADELGGVKNLSTMEKMILAKLSPKAVKQAQTIPGNPLMPGAQSATTRTAQVTRQPTYALVDDVRRDLTAAKFSRQGPFKDSDDRLITMLEGELRKDQKAIADEYGMGETWDLAQRTSASYKAIQDDLISLFGKNLDESFAGDLSTAVKALPGGDPTKFLNLMKSIPESMRPQVVASGLNTAFGKSAVNSKGSFTSYATWYEGLLKNKQSYTAIMTYLEPGARKQLSDLYRVSKGISLASKERIQTGRIRAIEKDFQPIDTFTSRLYETASRSVVGATVGSAVGYVAGPGVGAAVASALTRGAKPEALKAVDKLIVSPEFVELAKNAGGPGARQATRRLTQSPNWKRFAHFAKLPANSTAAERWAAQALQAENQQD